MVKPSRKLIITVIAAVTSLAVVFTLYKVNTQDSGSIVGKIRHSPGSCINAGLGCYENYLEMKSGSLCEIDVKNAENYSEKRVSIVGSIEYYPDSPLCYITINSIKEN